MSYKSQGINYKPSRRYKSSYGGFTLVELLVIVTIILILFAFTIGTVNYVQIQARKMNCANNFKQLYAALELYALENDGQYPPPQSSSPSWGTVLYPAYLDDEHVFDCYYGRLGTAVSPDYGYIQPTDGMLDTAEVVIDYTNHAPYGGVALYRSGKIIVK